MPHDPHAAERAGDGSNLGLHEETQETEEQENDGETEEETRDNDDGDEAGTDVTTPGGHHGDEYEKQQVRSRSLTESTKSLAQGDDDPLTSRTRTRSSRSVSSSTVSSSSTLIPPPGGSRKKSAGATTAAGTSEDGGDEEESLDVDDVDVVEEQHLESSHVVRV